MTRYHLMLDYQTKIAPFTPTFKELLDVWRVATISAVNYTLKKLVERGLVIYREHGNSRSYYAVRNNANEQVN